nr:hypothetical protein [Pseudomonas alcaligenes]
MVPWHAQGPFRANNGFAYRHLGGFLDGVIYLLALIPVPSFLAGGGLLQTALAASMATFSTWWASSAFQRRFPSSARVCCSG